MKTEFVSVALAVAVSLTVGARESAALKARLAPADAVALYRELLDPAKVPVAFEYGGERYEGLGGCPIVEGSRKTVELRDGRSDTYTVEIEPGFTATVTADYAREYGARAWKVAFANVGKTRSKRLKDVACLCRRYVGKNPILRGIRGDHAWQYAPYVQDFAVAGDIEFVGDTGRATHIVFPYFNLEYGYGGEIFALGWAGNWKALFSTAEADEVVVRASTCFTIDSELEPGEDFVTGRVVALPYQGRGYQNSMNLWRRYYLDCVLPRADAKGRRLKPFTTASFAGDTGLPNTDGSISERFTTWTNTLDKLYAEKVIPDFRWFDAGWYVAPDGKIVEGTDKRYDWHNQVGTWTFCPFKWPGHTMADSIDECHALGMKAFLWFEPERVTHVDQMVKKWGYRREWAIGRGKPNQGWTNDLGQPDCLAWTLRKVTGTLAAGHFDMYREDNNAMHAEDWWHEDKRLSEVRGYRSRGLTENRFIRGHYALWDGIIADCAKRGGCPYVDSCASGGGRNDLESMRRGFPMMRSDKDRTTTALRLSMSSTFNHWIPFHGSSTKESATELGGGSRTGEDAYVNRASLLPIYSFGGAFSHNRDLNWDNLRRNIAEWRSVNDLLTKDLYVLTPWHHQNNRYGWTVFVYDDPAKDESVILAFRQEEARKGEFFAKLPFLEPKKVYEVKDDDTGKTAKKTGMELRDNGWRITLAQPRSSALVRIRAL